ncbi:hypothetical protein CJ226_16265 [Microbacterium sp. UMB0228]|nr:hypothetical protein CJ226_16265 [Microbacterium sp. UMB0228]
MLLGDRQIEIMVLEVAPKLVVLRLQCLLTLCGVAELFLRDSNFSNLCCDEGIERVDLLELGRFDPEPSLEGLSNPFDPRFL